LNSTGSHRFSTYLGGSNDDRGFGITTDVGNSVYVTRIDRFQQFPVAGPFQRTNAGGQSDVFVTKLNPTGAVALFHVCRWSRLDQSMRWP
jgi:hypothetical protein